MASREFRFFPLPSYPSLHPLNSFRASTAWLLRLGGHFRGRKSAGLALTPFATRPQGREQHLLLYLRQLVEFFPIYVQLHRPKERSADIPLRLSASSPRGRTICADLPCVLRHSEPMWTTILKSARPSVLLPVRQFAVFHEEMGRFGDSAGSALSTFTLNVWVARLTLILSTDRLSQPYGAQSCSATDSSRTTPR